MKSTEVIAGLLAFAVMLPCWTVGAAPKPLSPATRAVVSSAEGAFKAGEFARASQLYEQAWKAAQDDTTLLYSAGRCAQLAAQLVRAEALLVQYLGLAAQEEKFLIKAKGYLADVRAALAEERAAQARQAADRGAQLQGERRYREAATQFAEAYRLDERQLRWLVQAGEAAALACDVAVARRHLELAALKAGPDSAEGQQARQRLATLDADCAAKTALPTLPPESGSAPPPAPTTLTEPGTRWGPVALVGAGVLVAAGGGVLYAVGNAEYDQYVRPHVAAGQSSQAVIDYDESLRSKYFLPGKVLGGVGAAAVVAGGLWWWLGKPGAAQLVAVGPHGVTVAWRL